MTPNKNFKFTKRNKTLMALLKHSKPEMRHTFRAMMIQAQLASDVRGSSSERK
jgi:hypothetical protein